MGSIAKSLLFLTIIFLAAITFIGLVLPKNDTISITHEINCSGEKAFELISNVKNWEQWSPWKNIDDNAQIEISESTVGKGAWYQWKGNWKIGQGKLEIVDLKPNEYVQMNFYTIDNKSLETNIQFHPSPKGQQLVWTVSTKNENEGLLQNILASYSTLIMKSFIEKHFTLGLKNIEHNCK